MKKIKMKIVDWDEENLTWFVKFSSDVDDNDIDSARSFALTPWSMFPDVTDLNEIIEKSVASGLFQCMTANNLKKAKKNKELTDSLASVKGKTFEYDVEYLENLNRPDRSEVRNYANIPGIDIQQEDIYVC